jgi:hypothetical protein
MPDIKLIKAEELDEAWNVLETNNKDGIRYVIDIQASLE